MIKSYLELNEKEKKKALEFIKDSKNIHEAIEDFKSDIEGKICNHGEGVLFYLEDNEIKGKVSVILEVVERLNTVYINKLICPYDNKEILKGLIDEARILANNYNANKILIGIRDEKILNLAGAIGLSRSYSSYNMILQERNREYNTLEKIKLSSDNIREYVDIYNRSFMDMPHGTFISIEDAEKYLEKQSETEEHFMVTNDNGEYIGFLDTCIKGNKGFFDIGLIEEYRGRGYGKILLETAIKTLIDKNVENICLTVIEKNKIAFEMYKKRGFKIYKKLSDWIE